MKPLLALLAIALLIAGATACGSGSSSAPSPSTTASASAPAPPGATTASPATPTATTALPPTPAATTGTAATKPVPSPGGGPSSSGAGTGSAIPRHARYPHGDTSIQTYGKAAGESDKQAVAAAVKRYYAALAAGDGATACRLLSSGVSRFIVQQLVGQSPSLRVKGCSGILSALISRRAAASQATVEVIGVRIKQDRGFALLRSKRIPSGEIAVEREGGVWKLAAIGEGALP